MRTTTIILIMLTLFLITSCFREIPIEEVKKCEFDSDCILTDTVGCCKCPTTINSEYKEYWEKLDKKESKNCEGVVCEMCGPTKVISKECRNNTCTEIYSPVGLGMVT